MRVLFIIFALGLGGSNYPLKADVLTVAPSFFSTSYKISTMEIFKAIKGYEGIYEVSNLGRIKSLKRIDGYGRQTIDKILKLSEIQGYKKIDLNNGISKTFRVHRLVAIAFIPNPENKPEVNHKKGIKVDNRASELEWCTPSENSKHAYRELGIKPTKAWLNKFGSDHCRSKKIMQFSDKNIFITDFSCASEAERMTNIQRTNITKVCIGKRKKAGGYIWKYKL